MRKYGDKNPYFPNITAFIHSHVSFRTAIVDITQDERSIMKLDPLSKAIYFQKLDSFDHRAKKYTVQRIEQFNSANILMPGVRNTERQIIIDKLHLQEGQVIADLAAGGGYLSKGIEAYLSGRCKIVCIENSQHFLDSLPQHYSKVLSSLVEINLPNNYSDRIGCLAGIHHLEKKHIFFQEAWRILKPGGRLVVGDVLIGSAAAKFLNGPVNEFSDIGHDGAFLSHKELTNYCLNAGFTDVSEVYCTYTWDFPDKEAMVRFCKTIFRLTKASFDQVEQAITENLEVTTSSRGLHLWWSLVVVSAVK